LLKYVQDRHTFSKLVNHAAAGANASAIGIAAEPPESAKALETKIFVLCDYAFIAGRHAERSESW
jgi:hypothetical protein